MNSESFVIPIIKVAVSILVFIYFLLGILITRQVFLMNKAIKTKLAGCLNVVALIHVFLILCILLVVIIA